MNKKTKSVAKKKATKKSTPKKTTPKKSAKPSSKKSAASSSTSAGGKGLRSFLDRKVDKQATGKLLVVMDETSESLAALRFAGVSAKRLDSRLVLMMAVETETQRHWLGVESIIKEEALQTALEKIRNITTEVADYIKTSPDIIIREGTKFEALTEVVMQDPTITAIVIGVTQGEDAAKATPMIEKVLAGHLGRPVIIVPEDMSEKMLLRIARLI